MQLVIHELKHQSLVSSTNRTRQEHEGLILSGAGMCALVLDVDCRFNLTRLSTILEARLIMAIQEQRPDIDIGACRIAKVFLLQLHVIVVHYTRFKTRDIGRCEWRDCHSVLTQASPNSVLHMQTHSLRATLRCSS